MILARGKKGDEDFSSLNENHDVYDELQDILDVKEVKRKLLLINLRGS